MTTLAITFNGTISIGQKLGDTLTSIKAAYLFAQGKPCDKYILTLSRQGELNFLWQKFIDTYKVEVVYDDFHPGNMPERFAFWDKCRRERQVNGQPFDVYKELYRRIDGGERQRVICGKEAGLGRKNIFQYFLYGQETVEPVDGSESFGDELIYHTNHQPERDVLIAPLAICQRNDVFTMTYWQDVVRRLVAEGISVSVAHNGPFCDDLNGNPLYVQFYESFPYLQDQICRHRLVSCGNTGVGWLAAACGTPLLAMQHPESNMQDYRYEWCGVKSLVEFLETPDVDYCVKRIIEEVRGIPRSARPSVNRTADINKAVRDVQHLTPNPPEKMRLLAQECLSVADVPGAMADVGAYKGAASIIMQRMCPEKELHAFDTWEGVLEDDPLCHHKPGEWKAEFHEFLENVGGGEDVNASKGVFPRSADGLEDKRFSFVFIDVDVYGGTKAALEWFWPRMVKGGKIVIDDTPGWNPCAGCEKAVLEFFPQRNFREYGNEHMTVVTKT